MSADIRFMARWELLFPYDQWWREKHNIPFDSSAHREMNMFSIMYEYLEEYKKNKDIVRYKERKEKRKLFEQGVWIIDRPEKNIVVTRFDGFGHMEYLEKFYGPELKKFKEQLEAQNKQE